MADIHVLSDQVANMITAGEVIDRPCSAAKELIENAIDAGATDIQVELRHGGVTYLRVTDNGSGIAAEDVPTAFMSHATSKIEDVWDLENVATLGFRGEALAAIASVARVEMLTKPREAQMGYSYVIENGEVQSQGPAGCPDGTTVVVKSLFFNHPIRYKFLKRDPIESAAVAAMVQREALAHPEIAFHLTRDGKHDFSTPGDGVLEHVVCTLFPDLFQDMIYVEGGAAGIRVTGFVSKPTACRGSRQSQYFFVNGRWIKSKTMTAALENAYQNQKMVGKFPAAVLHAVVPYNQLDVNSNPNKTEIRFYVDKNIYDATYVAVLSGLGSEPDRPQMEWGSPWLPTMEQPEPHPTENSTLFFNSPKNEPKLPFVTQAPAQNPPPPAQTEGEREAPPPVEPETPPPARFGRSEGFFDLVTPPSPAREEAPGPVSAAPQTVLPPAPEWEQTALTGQSPGETPWRVVGEVLRTYIIVEQGDKVLFIDKHAAHERMGFDALKTQDYRPMAQELLEPQVVTLSPEDTAVLLEHAQELEEFAFGIEPFGQGTLLVRQVPDFLAPEEVPAELEDLARRYREGGADPAGRRDELLHSMACKAAMKGGQKNRAEELMEVARAVLTGQVTHCPHGRPVSVELTRKQLEREFKRIT